MVRSYFGLFWALRPWCCKQRMPFYCAQRGPRLMGFCLEGTVAPTMKFSESEIVFPRITIAFDLNLSQLVFDTRHAGESIDMQSCCTWLAPENPFWRSLCVALVVATRTCLTEGLMKSHSWVMALVTSNLAWWFHSLSCVTNLIAADVVRIEKFWLLLSSNKVTS